MSDPHVYRHLTADQARLLDALTEPQAAVLERLWHGDPVPGPGGPPAALKTLRAAGLIEAGGYRGQLGPPPGWGLTEAGLTLLINLGREIEDEKRFASRP